MLKYTKRLISDIRFWCQECKIRRKENEEFERIEDETYTEMRHPMEGYAYYQTMNHNRKERLRQHKEKRALIK